MVVFWQLSGKYMAPFWQISCNFLATFQKLSGKFFLNFFPYKLIAGSWLLEIDCLKLIAGN